MHQESVQRIETLSQEQNLFIETFLTTNKYFYVPSTEKFFYYDGVHYQIYSEDDILYNVLSTISRDRNLMSWKQMTKVYIMKRIKQNSLLKSIPESETIQYVLDNLYPAFFSSKVEAKYFLTILGDNIFRKNVDLIHFVDNKAKKFIRELNVLSQCTIGLGLSQTFKHKYHEQHDYKDCRLVKINDCIKSENTWTPVLNTCFIDILCVACHYSIRFGSSDDVILKHYCEPSLISGVFYLCDVSQETLIETFVNEYLQFSSGGAAVHVSWKNMQYLWKHFLESKNLPSVIFQQKLKELMVMRMAEYYNQDMDVFAGVCSKFLPSIQQFLAFWNDTMDFDETEVDFEIEDIAHLFRKWCRDKDENYSNLNDKQIIDIITYYFPEVEIEQDKYISNIRCSMWDKQLDVQVALETMKETLRGKNQRELGIGAPVVSKHISIYDAYIFYCKHFGGIANKRFVNKYYFEKYIFEKMPDYVLDNKFIHSDWLSI
jgi:hypothetical protein